MEDTNECKWLTSTHWGIGLPVTGTHLVCLVSSKARAAGCPASWLLAEAPSFNASSGCSVIVLQQ